MKKTVAPAEKRKNERLVQLRRHYEIEKRLASKLRSASREERRYLYSDLYDKLYRQVPNHPQLLRKANPELQLRRVHERMLFLKRFLKPDSLFLEVGPGDCSLCREVAKHVKKVYAIDVSEEITKNKTLPSNFSLVISDGSSIPVPQRSVDIVYSDNLMEHLHPDDSAYQLRNIYRALKHGGKYICITPNRLSGPHDISRFFDEVATGFHLKEYTVEELRRLFAETGFTELEIYIGGKGRFVKFSVSVIIALERILSCLPSSLKKRVARSMPIRAVLGITMIARK